MKLSLIFLPDNHCIHLNSKSISFVIEIFGICHFLSFIISINNCVLLTKNLKAKESRIWVLFITISVAANNSVIVPSLENE